MKNINPMVNNNHKKALELNYVVEGEGQPVVLVHGLAASLYDWQFLMPVLVNHGYRAYALDLLGHGNSPKPDQIEAYHFDSLSWHFSHWLNTLGLEQPAVLVGHSLGGFLSLHHAANHPDSISGLILIDPFYDSRQLSPLLRAVNRRPKLVGKAIRIIPPWMVNKVMHWDLKPMNEYSQLVRQQMAEDYKRVSPHFIQITHSLPDLNSELEKIEHSTLVLWGDNDITLKPKSFPNLVERLPGAEGHVITECGHQPHLAKPDTLNQIVLKFLTSRNIKAGAQLP
jgi:pimeloyl-ACP methyl ester carboxylesterase